VRDLETIDWDASWEAGFSRSNDEQQQVVRRVSELIHHRREQALGRLFYQLIQECLTIGVGTVETTLNAHLGGRVIVTDEPIMLILKHPETGEEIKRWTEGLPGATS